MARGVGRRLESLIPDIGTDVGTGKVRVQYGNEATAPVYGSGLEELVVDLAGRVGALEERVSQLEAANDEEGDDDGPGL